MSQSGSASTGRAQPTSGSVNVSTAECTGCTVDAILGATPILVPRLQGGNPTCFSGSELKKREGLPLKFVLMKTLWYGNVDIEKLKMFSVLHLRQLREFLEKLRVYDMDEVFVRGPAVFEQKSNNICVPWNGSLEKSLFDVLNGL